MSSPQTVHYIGLDVHKESIAVAIAVEDGELRAYGTVGGSQADVDRLLKKLQLPGVALRFCYEAGPCGYVLYRHLIARGHRCIVVAPSLTPQGASHRVKTDRRDARNLARLFRAGELTAITVPDAEDEAIRDLVRARLRAVEDQRRARQRLRGFLLRLGFRYTGKSRWTTAHMNYLVALKMPTAAQQIAFEEYKQAIGVAGERIERLTAALSGQLEGWKWKPVVAALMSLRGVQLINAMTLMAELGDLSRFEHPAPLMSFLGLTPSEDSSGARRRQGAITKAGNEAARRALVEAAHSYRLPARLSPTLQARQHGQSEAVRAMAWQAQVRLCGRYRQLKRREKNIAVVVTAVARELAGFVWAIACTAMGKPPSGRAARPAAGQAVGAGVYQLKPPQRYRPRAAGLEPK